MAYFKKFGNITSCRLFSRPNAKVQQARIVYDNADSIARFANQWAVYCFSTCLRITPCFYTVDQKAARHQYVATLTQLPPNVKDINLAPLTRDLGAKAVNVPLSLNSYKPKRWAYVTFNSQETMDAAMEQTVSFQGKWFNVNQPPRRSNSNAANTRSHSRSRSKSKDRSAPSSRRDINNINNSYNHYNNVNNNNHNKPNPNTFQPRPLPRQTPNSALSPDDANNILNLLRELQCEVANFHKRISALELADQRMTRIESHLGLDPLFTPNELDLDLMQEDTPVSHVPLNIQSSAKSSLPPRSNLTRPSPSTTNVPNTSLPSSHLSPNAPPFTPISSTQEEINDLKNSRVVIEKLQCEVANFHKRISALELADQRMTRIESHLGLDPLPSPNEPEPDLMQEDAPVTHVPLNILSSAKSSLPPKSILTRPSPTFTIVPDTSPPSSHLSPNAPPFTPISSTQEEINDLKNSRVAIESKLDQLTGHIKQFIGSLGGAPLEQADSASSN
ncbi:hypothetical protein RhiirB3_532492 [Rhizophagus irregularis]|nr:hypothetical protein RhiirB3_532492 [Rhizophagus irregularis]